MASPSFFFLTVDVIGGRGAGGSVSVGRGIVGVGVRVRAIANFVTVGLSIRGPFGFFVAFILNGNLWVKKLDEKQ